ncbi:acyl-CoA dehydrogenase family protein [Pajaroellobacter abortibovis]|uniref:Acyl-CoA dehydrogenase n=1 Tax=Pajaroellobacter abortibovis TaxID=1882918 RepID=A0A1L6MWB8_9BACT|nr:acyl-CoA dehydrogenase family protein [Pajaroellobacter abortibovis]APR99840.1 hypothetical protein BCY86_03475 [Pajaroellobacter abortibovis]
MNFDLTPDQESARQRAYIFAQHHLVPQIDVLEREKGWFRHLLPEISSGGWMGINVPKEYGGGGEDSVACALILEEMSAAWAPCGMVMGVHLALFCDPLSWWGTSRQKELILRPAAKGEKIGCCGSFRGESVHCLQASPENDGERWLLNGVYHYVINGPYADYMLVLAEEVSSSRAIAFVVPMDRSGITRGETELSVGTQAEYFCSVSFKDCIVSADDQICAIGNGEEVARAIRDRDAIRIACQAIGIARTAMEHVISHTNKCPREIGGASSEYQTVQFMIANIAVGLDVARLLVWKAALKKDQGSLFAEESVVAKIYATDMVTRVVQQALQVCGYFHSEEASAVRRCERDATITALQAGPVHIERLCLGRSPSLNKKTTASVS